VDGEVVSRWNNVAHDRLERLRAADRAQVEFLDGMLPGTGYEDAFARLDVLVLPYTAEYGMRGSGVLWEAIHGRKALILSMESGLCSELDAVGYPYLSIPAGDPQAIAKAVAEMSETWPGTKAAIAAFHQSQPQLPADVFRSLLGERLSKLDLARDGYRRHPATVRSANMRSR
jgi:glycosyltransferase involved in cell wall biosynthesis